MQMLTRAATLVAVFLVGISGAPGPAVAALVEHLVALGWLPVL